MQVNGFKKSVFGGLKQAEVLSYLEQMSKDVETKLRNKEDDIRELKKELMDKKDKIKELKKELDDQKQSYEAKLKDQKEEFQEKADLQKQQFQKEKEEILEKLNDMKIQFTLEKEKIGRALLTAEETANGIIANAKLQGDELIAQAKKKADLEKERYQKQKAEVSDFTYDIKKLMDKLTADLKEKLD